ncbi:hypothetical protein PTKIN_Ptkin04bG0204900 [Pterospermum kingtungense]
MNTLTINLTMPPSPLPLKSRHVAVVGAGASGLVAARELRREGHSVVVFERGDEIGGTWVYTPRTEPDPLGLDLNRPIVHTSLYSSLRTNLPREVMGFVDFPFVTRPGEDRDPRRFPGHREVLMYLKDFAIEFGVEEMVRFETEVVKVRISENGKWKVRSKRSRPFCNENNDNYNDDDMDKINDETYDAVVVCNGHYTEPRIAEIPGINLWPGKQMHSHNYRVPEPFRDQVVIVIGSSASAVDICRDIAAVAKEVHVASRSAVDETYTKLHGYDNLWFHSMIDSAREDGTVVFRNGKVVLADVIMHCTGYKYHFPFLDTNGIVTVDDNRLGPLYKHVFPPALAPCLSFVGIPWKIVPFPLCEFQSKWIAGALSGRITLPSQKEMMEDVKALYATLEASGIPKRYTHLVGDSQFEYNNWLAAQCGCQGTEKWRKQMYLAAFENKHLRPETYRDEWDDQHLVVIVIGSSSSAVDICRDVAAVAKEVHVASRSVADETYRKQDGYDNLWFHSMIDSAREDGTVDFRNGKVVLADVIMHCTGYCSFDFSSSFGLGVASVLLSYIRRHSERYKYHFPFLDTNGIVTVDDNRLGPLYKHIVPFPLCELQSKWIAGVLSGRTTLPSQKEMMEEVKAFYATLEASGIPKRYTHLVGESQFEYNNWLAAQCGCQGTEKWRKQMYLAASENRHLRPETYRDEWDDLLTRVDQGAI